MQQAAMIDGPWALAGALALALVSAGTTIFVAWLQRRNLRGEMAAVKATAQEAADLSRPTGNGYADVTRDQLAQLLRGQDRIEGRLDRVEVKLDDHISAHANAGLNAVTGTPRPRR